MSNAEALSNRQAEVERVKLERSLAKQGVRLMPKCTAWKASPSVRNTARCRSRDTVARRWRGSSTLLWTVLLTFGGAFGIKQDPVYAGSCEPFCAEMPINCDTATGCWWYWAGGAEAGAGCSINSNTCDEVKRWYNDKADCANAVLCDNAWCRNLIDKCGVGDCTDGVCTDDEIKNKKCSPSVCPSPPHCVCGDGTCEAGRCIAESFCQKDCPSLPPHTSSCIQCDLTYQGCRDKCFRSYDLFSRENLACALKCSEDFCACNSYSQCPGACRMEAPPFVTSGVTGHGVMTLQCANRDCIVMDRIPSNCLTKWEPCPHCEGGGCPLELRFEGFTAREWEISLIDDEGHPVAFDHHVDRETHVVQFQTERNKYIDGLIGNYVLVFSLGPDGIAGKEYKVRTTVKLIGEAERKRPSPGTSQR